MKMKRELHLSEQICVRNVLLLSPVLTLSVGN